RLRAASSYTAYRSAFRNDLPKQNIRHDAATPYTTKRRISSAALRLAVDDGSSRMEYSKQRWNSIARERLRHTDSESTLATGPGQSSKVSWELRQCGCIACFRRPPR